MEFNLNIDTLINSITPKKDKYIVAYQGTNGAYSEEATIGHFGENVETKAFKTFEDVFIAISENNADYGVLPVENSSTGGIYEVIDLLKKYNCYVVGEEYVKINHCLLALNDAKIEDITEIYSHAQGFYQSRSFLKDFAGIKETVYFNTALSAKKVKDDNDKTKAAIASKRCAELYNLKILAENINSSSTNTTRFVVISKNLEVDENSNKISLVFTLPHKTGSLFGIIKLFAENGLNLLKIESRPIADKKFEYLFFVDFEGNILNEQVYNILKLVENKTDWFKFLGNYKQNFN